MTLLVVGISHRTAPVALLDKVALVDGAAERFYGQIETSVSAATGSLDQATALLDKDDDFDLVLLDLRMPGMDGLETTRCLRNGVAGEAAQHVVNGNSGVIRPSGRRGARVVKFGAANHERKIGDTLGK